MARIECATASAAFLGPRRNAIRWYCADRYVFFWCAAAWAACSNALRKAWLPCRTRLLRRLPALSLLPGATPAHAHRCAGVGKRAMSVPTSLTITSATAWPTPGIVSRCATASVKGRQAVSILWSKASILSSRASRRERRCVRIKPCESPARRVRPDARSLRSSLGKTRPVLCSFSSFL